MPRKVGDWTRDKLKILEDYLPVYLQATTTALERIYIDGFAGPGQNILEPGGQTINGSPLIALEATAQNGTRFDHLYFVERDRSSAEELEAIVRDRGESDRADVICGDVNTELPRLIQRIHRRSPTFVFLDTVGIEPRWETIQAIAPWKTEMLINFPLGMSINRNPQSPKVDAYFGTKEWRPLWSSSATGRTRRLLDLYKSRLADLGYSHAVKNERLVKMRNNQALYYLVFVSKVEAGKRIMEWVYDRPDATGQGRLL